MARVSVEIPEELKREFKKVCAEKQYFMKGVIAEIIEKWIRRHK